MKRMRDQLFVLGSALVMTLGVVLAQDQAPVAVPPPALQKPMAVAPNGVPGPRPGTGAIPARRNVTPTIRRPTPPSMGGAQPTVAAVPSADASGPGEAKEPHSKTTTPALKFDNAPADIILQAYAQETGKTLLMAPDVPKANITLKSQADVQLTKEEYIEAIEAVLGMNGIVFEPFGEKFMKVLARKSVRTDGIKIIMESPEGGYPEKGKVVSQMIQLKSITVAEAQKALEGFKHADAQFQTFERTNSILVTDTQENVNRMMEIVKFIDQPLVATEEVNVRQIRFAKADDIKKRLEELVAESQKQTQSKDEIKANTSGAPGITRTSGISSSLSGRTLPPGLTRLGVQPQPAATPNETLETLVSDADRGMIRGKVQIIADERTNQLIIITRADNMAFFERIITVLDVETAPDVKVEVQRMEFADAEEISTMLNDLIGNASAKKDDKSAKGSASKGSASKSGTGTSPNTSGAAPEAAKSTSLAEAVAARTNSRTDAGAGDSAQSKLGQLSKDNIKILADKRTNAIIMMGSIGDLAAIKEIIKGMDIQLDQVLIETVVLQVELGNDLQTGIDWIVGSSKNGGNVFNNGDQLAGGGGSGAAKLESLMAGGATNVINSGINYFLKANKINVSALISAAQSDNRTKVLSSPVLLTVDNKEATIEATSMRYLYKGVRSSYTGNSNYSEVPDYEQRDIGLTVKVTPRINPKGMVVLTIDEKFETIGANQTVGTDSYPTINTRKLAADVSVDNMQTVVLGGLVQSEVKTENSGIPILKNIPWVGKYLFGSTSLAESRSELLVFMTPYVLKTPAEATAEAQRRKDSLHDDRPWDDGGWSKSKLADPVSQKEQLERARMKWLTEDQEHDAMKTHDKAMRAREQQLLERAQMDADEAKADEQQRVRPAAAKFEIAPMKVTESVQVVRPVASPAAEKGASKAAPVPATGKDSAKQAVQAEKVLAEPKR